MMYSMGIYPVETGGVHICGVAKLLLLTHDKTTSLADELRTAPPDTGHVGTGAGFTSRSTDTSNIDTATRQCVAAESLLRTDGETTSLVEELRTAPLKVMRHRGRPSSAHVSTELRVEGVGRSKRREDGAGSER